MLIENDKFIRKDKKISQYFNEYFATITVSLNISDFLTPTIQYIGEIVCNAMEKFASYPSNERCKFSSVNLTFSQ